MQAYTQLINYTLMKQFNYLVKVFFIVAFSNLYAQTPNEQDCLGALPVCNFVYNQPNSYSGEGNIPNEINSGPSCLGSGEKNDVWYIFTVQQSGTLNFSIEPVDMNDDYDWAVYNLSNNPCSDIYNNSALEVSCNFSGTDGITGPNDLSGSQNESSFNISAGETYVVNVSNYSSTQSGYNIDFSASSAVIFDNIPPFLQTVTPPTTAAVAIDILFSENITCPSVTASDFRLVAPDGSTIVINSINGAVCANGGAYEDAFTLNLATPINQCGDYKLYLQSPVEDNCGNITPLDTFTFSGVGSPNATVSTIANTSCDSINQPNGSATVTITGVTANYTINWIPQGSTGASLNNLARGNYQVIVSLNSNAACADTTDYIIQNNAIPLQANLTTTESSCGRNNGTASVVVSTGTGPYTTVWSNGLTPNQLTSPNLGVNNYTVTVSNALRCTDDTTFSIVDNSAFNSSIAVTPDLCGITSNGTATVTTNSPNAALTYTYQWIGINANGATANNLPHGNYQVIVTTNQGCKDTLPVSIGILTQNPIAKFAFNPLRPNTFDPVIDFIDQSSNASQWAWDLGDGSVQNLANFSYQYITPDTYAVTLIIRDVYGCADTITNLVPYEYVSTLYVPNVFTPNENGLNEVFKVQGIDLDSTKFSLQIYDRWGEILFTTTKLDEGWNGGKNNKLPVLPDGIYSYKIQAQGKDKKYKKLAGRVSLLK